MKLLRDILYGVRIVDIKGPTNIAIDYVEYDSRKVKGYSLFVAIKGTQTDGHQFISKAIEDGAIAIVCENLPDSLRPDITYVHVQNSARALGFISSNFFDNPSEKLKLIGVTGTNGKTTSVTLLYNLFRLLGKRCGLLSTVVNKIHTEVVPSTHTTPMSLEINELLSKMVEKGCTHCFMEVSSHAVHQHRIAGLQFAGAVFTNITHDHLDYHGTFDEYIKAKKGFFDMLGEEAFALTNADQTHGETMIHDTKAKKRSYAINNVADFRAKILENQFLGLQLNIDGFDTHVKLIGTFNAYNALVAYSVASLLGEDKLTTLATLSNLTPPEGRFQYIKSRNGITAIVDYAHTPDALENVLNTIKEIRTGNEMVITVVGCGGNRDKAKRPLMAKIACELSNQIIFTSDNPRNEDPEVIIADMQKGVDVVHYKKTLSIVNRKEAIRTACSMAHKGDIILVAGKGHEKYQEIKGEIFPFDDFEILNETFQTLEK
ncbi:MAG: UDP-N-acetylmuramoyl-L-alanyl-D-glutamate--2,6-diaminopimelate ligase [Flavobacteriales bacterium]